MGQLDNIQKSVDRVLTLEERILDLISEEIPLDTKWRPLWNTTWMAPAHILMQSTFDFMIETVTDPHGVWIRIISPAGDTVWRRHFTFVDPPKFP